MDLCDQLYGYDISNSIQFLVGCFVIYTYNRPMQICQCIYEIFNFQRTENFDVSYTNQLFLKCNSENICCNSWEYAILVENWQVSADYLLFYEISINLIWLLTVWYLLPLQLIPVPRSGYVYQLLPHLLLGPLLLTWFNFNPSMDK